MMMGVQTKIKESRFFLAATLFLVVSFLVWWNPASLFQPVRGVLSTIVLPFENIFSWTAFEIADIRDFFVSIGHLKSENARLQKENQSLFAQISKLNYLDGENRELRSLVDLTRSPQTKGIAGEVIARDSSGLSTVITIDRGSSQGVEPGMAAVSSEKVLVGKVVKVFPASSEIMLLPNPESVVSAALSTNNSKGVIRGDHGLGMIFDLALQSEDLKPGAAIVSTGLGDGLPPGILIGTIESTQPSPDRLFQQAIVVSPVRFDTLRFVIILSGS